MLRPRLGEQFAAAILVMALVGACETAPTVPATVGALSMPPSESPMAVVNTVAPAEPTPTPTSSAVPTTGPTASPTASPVVAAHPYAAGGEINDVSFAPDGRITVVVRDWAAAEWRVATLDESGTLLPGWPWSPGAGEDRATSAAPGPAGSLYVASRGPEEDHWVLHRLDAGAAELPGFPVELPNASTCAVTDSADGTAYVACERSGGTGIVSAVRPDASMVGGWPIKFAGGASVEGFRPDGAVVISVSGAHGSIVTVVRPAGTTVPGWPRSAHGASVAIDGRGRIHLTVHAWEEDACAPAISSTYRVLRGDGSSLAGWPVKVYGWASEPVVDADGSMTIVTGRGRAIRYAPNGAVVDGWPVRDVKVDIGCSGYPGSSPADAGSGGVVITAGKGSKSSTVTLLTPGGRLARGWPVVVRFELAIGCRFCTGGDAGPLPPAVGKRGIYFGAYGGNNRPRIVAIDRDGSLPADRQHPFGKAGDEILWVRIAPSGRVWMALSRPAGEDVTGLLVPVANDRPLDD